MGPQIIVTPIFSVLQEPVFASLENAWFEKTKKENARFSLEDYNLYLVE